MKVTLQFDKTGCLERVDYEPAEAWETIAKFIIDAARNATDIAEDFDGASETPLGDAFDFMVDSTQCLYEEARAQELAEDAANRG